MRVIWPCHTPDGPELAPAEAQPILLHTVLHLLILANSLAPLNPVNSFFAIKNPSDSEVSTRQLAIIPLVSYDLFILLLRIGIYENYEPHK